MIVLPPTDYTQSDSMHTVLCLCSLCALSVLCLCSFCALSVLFLCSFCALSVLFLCSFCALSVLFLCSFCALSVLFLCSFCALSYTVSYTVWHASRVEVDSLCNTSATNYKSRLQYKKHKEHH